MRNITFTVITLIVIGLCVTVGYFALTWMKNPAEYVASSNDTIGDMIAIETDDSQSSLDEPIVALPDSPDTNEELAGNFKKLLDAKTVLKVGSTGQPVAYLQEFLNIYFKQDKTVTSKFTAETEADYKKFQSQSGLPQTGQVGTQGMTAIIDWLKKN